VGSSPTSGTTIAYGEGGMQKRAAVQASAEQWVQCARCKKILFRPDFERALRVCSHCGHHHRLRARERILLTVDPDSFQETDAELRPSDPLGFPEYADKLRKGASCGR
jgi:acetyl-CoA carboxylase beta subunit